MQTGAIAGNYYIFLTLFFLSRSYSGAGAVIAS